MLLVASPSAISFSELSACILQTEEEKLVVEKRAKDAELLASRVLEDSEFRTREMEQLKGELERARKAENSAKEKLASLVSSKITSTSLYNSHCFYFKRVVLSVIESMLANIPT